MPDYTPSQRAVDAAMGSSLDPTRPVSPGDTTIGEDATDNTVRGVRYDDILEDLLNTRGGNWFPNSQLRQRCLYHKNVFMAHACVISAADYATPHAPYALKIVPTGSTIQAYLQVNPADYGVEVEVGDEWLVSCEIKGESVAAGASLLCKLKDDALQSSYTTVNSGWKSGWQALKMPSSTIGGTFARLQLFIYGAGFTGDGSEAVYVTNIVFCKAAKWRWDLKNLRWEAKWLNISTNGWSGKRLCVLGDSISDTYTTSTSSKHNLKWIGRVVENLGFSHYYNRAKGGTRVRLDDGVTMYVNENTGESCESGDDDAIAISGAMCGDDRIATIPVDSDLVVIFAGANDGTVTNADELGSIDDNPAVGSAETPASFYASYMAMIEKIYARCGDDTQIVLLGMHYHKAADLTPAPNYYKLRRKAISDIAELYGLPYLDLKAVCQMNRYNSVSYANGGSAEIYYDTGNNDIHLSALGDDKVASAVIGLLKRVEPVDSVDVSYS